jgi:hypothetical protein
MILSMEQSKWKPFRNQLPKAERKLFDDMFDTAHLFNYAMMCSMPSHPVAIQPIFMAIVFSHFKQLTCISEELDRRDNPSTNHSEPESTRIPPPAHVPTKDNDI